MIAERVLISGRVQGIGYRDWLVALARGLNLSGWVRNLGTDQVEAVLCGDPDAVAKAIAACHHGPRGAIVTRIDRQPEQPPAAPGFTRLPSA